MALWRCNCGRRRISTWNNVRRSALRTSSARFMTDHLRSARRGVKVKRTRAGAESAALRTYALQQTRTLLRRLAFQINRAGRAGDADAVHDLRVAIRRFAQCLRAFDQCYPHGHGRKIQRKLKSLMQAASAVRDRDIAMELMRTAGIAEKSKA